MTHGTAPTLAQTLLPLLLLAPAVYCMLDVVRHPDTRRFTPQVWLAVCAFGNLIGLVAYLTYGRSLDR